MVLTGHLNDYPLSDLIEIFHHRRETGYLTVAYSEAPGHFYFRDGKLIDARVGDPSSLNRLSGTEAVDLALTLPAAPFAFDLLIQSPRLSGNKPSPSDMAEESSRLRGNTWLVSAAKESDKTSRAPSASALSRTATSLREENKLAKGAVSAILLFALAIGALTLALRRVENNMAEDSASIPPVVDRSEIATSDISDPDSTFAEGASLDEFPLASVSEAGGATRRRSRRWSASTNLMKRNSIGRPENLSVASAAPAVSVASITEETQGVESALASSQAVPITVRLDGRGRVTQAFVTNPRPGMKAHEATALRVARGRHYPTGKKGLERVLITVAQPD